MTTRATSTPTTTTTTGDTAGSSPARRWLAISRIALEFVFLWAFLDKTFGLGYATPPAKAWIRGGSPTAGFLGHVEVGPFRSVFTSLGGPVVDWLFMLGLLCVGLAFVLGIGLRVGAVAGTVMLVLMWAAEWPPARTTFEGQPSGSTNPLVDYHIIDALLLIVLALTAAGRTWGLGRAWESTTLVQRQPWLK